MKTLEQKKADEDEKLKEHEKVWDIW